MYACMHVSMPYLCAHSFDELVPEDLEILIETADKDKDGQISLDDFRQLLDAR